MNALQQQLESSNRIIQDQKKESERLENALKSSRTKLTQIESTFNAIKKDVENAENACKANQALILAEEAKAKVLKEAIQPSTASPNA